MMKNARFAVILICVFLAGFAVASLIWTQSGEAGQIDEVVAAYEPEPEPEIEPEPETEKPEPEAEEPEASAMWYEWHDMTFDDMRGLIMEHGGTVFENVSGIAVSFDDAQNIVSISYPFVMARGVGHDVNSTVDVIFRYQQWRHGWRVEAYSVGRWGGGWNITPELTRGLFEGRRYVEAETVTIRLFDAVDFGGGATPTYTSINITGERLVEDLIPLILWHKGIEILDAWYIGSRLYVNIDPLEAFDGTGTAGEYAILRAFLMTLFSLPDVEEVTVLIFGQSEGWVGGHGMTLGTYSRERFEYP